MTAEGKPASGARYAYGLAGEAGDDLPTGGFTFEAFALATACLLPHERAAVFHALPERLQTEAWRALERDIERELDR